MAIISRKPRAPVSVSVELLLSLGMLAVAALTIAVNCVILFWRMVDSDVGAIWLTLLICADVVIFLALGAYQIQRLVLTPLAKTVDATSAIAAGDLARRVPDAESRELATLASSINRMTDHLLAEQAARIRVEKLAGIGRLAAGVAHEIGNPLGVIVGYTDLLGRRVGDDAALRDAVEGIGRESARIDRIVRSLLDYAKPRRNTPGRIDVNETVSAAIQLLRDQGRLERIDLSLVLADPTQTIAGERPELEHMMLNLLLNAIDALGGKGRLAVATYRTPRQDLVSTVGRRESDPPLVSIPRKPSPRIEHWIAQSAHPIEEFVKIVVADAGPGIPEEDVDRVFDPFFTTKQPGQGTGLGLAIVARVVDNLSGIIWVQRAREGGAAFHALFPALGGVPGGMLPVARRDAANPAGRTR
ncbi:MAG TPA: HAMP domain-containing sensor histidine kinase [Gemmatimonadaceae bacterium]|nr:HAMP domain-containing sensor histidine kinase [Gemmatimonadaceae bacterium]